MWLPRGVDQFFEAALARLAEIKEALKDQERATCDACESPSADEGKKPGVIARIAVALETNNADVESYEKPQRAKEYGRQWWFLFWSGATAIFTAFAFGAAGIYACIANQQLGKMNETYQEMKAQTPLFKESADAAKSAAETAAKQLEAAERPWVTLNAAIDATAKYGLRFVPSISGSANFSFLISAKNIGPGVATEVLIQDEVSLDGSQVEEENFCNKVSHQHSTIERTLLPLQEPYNTVETPFLLRDQITDFENRPDNNGRRSLPEARFPAFLIACVAYHPSFDRSKRYYTGVIYRIRNSAAGVTLPLGGADIPASDMWLEVANGQGTIAK